jgi:hypothetical protein
MMFCGTDLHSNNSMVMISDAEDRITLKRRLPNSRRCPRRPSESASHSSRYPHLRSYALVMPLRFAWEDPYDLPALATRCRRPAGKGLHPAYARRWRGPFIPFAPASNRFVGDHDATLEQQLLDVAQAQAEPEVPANGAADDDSGETVAVIKRFGLLHRFILPPHLQQPDSADDDRGEAMAAIK